MATYLPNDKVPSYLVTYLTTDKLPYKFSYQWFDTEEEVIEFKKETDIHPVEVLLILESQEVWL